MVLSTANMLVEPFLLKMEKGLVEVNYITLHSPETLTAILTQSEYSCFEVLSGEEKALTLFDCGKIS